MKEKELSKKEFLQQRVIFRNKKIRDNFFLLLKNKYSSWKNLGNKFSIYKSRLENFRNGKLSIPYNKFIEMLNSIDNKETFLEKVIIKDKNWGKSKGGKKTYYKHKHIFEKGRQINLNKYLNKVEQNQILSPHLSEFIGAFIGDGFMNKYQNKYVIQITGHSTLDKVYYLNTLIPIIKIISPHSNPSIWEKNNTLRLTIYSKGLYILLSKRFNLIIGKKTHKIIIPKEIFESSDHKIINSCLRGIFDTDGCVFFDKRKTYTQPYIRIIINIRSTKLIRQINELLLKQHINSTITKNESRIQINGVIECKKFYEKIGFSNNRHLIKIKHLF